MVLLDIIHLGNKIYNGGSQDSDWLKFGFAFVVSFLMFLITNWYSKWKENKKKKKENENDVKYFQTAINDVLKGIPQQIEFYRSYSNEVKAAPDYTHELTMINLKNLVRISKKYDQQKMFQAYISQFRKNDTDGAIDSFMRIYTLLDTCLQL